MVNNSKDPYLFLIESISADVKEIKSDLKEYKKALDSEVTSLKAQQQKCNSYWGLVGKIISFGGLGSVASYLIAKIFPGNHN